MQGKFRSLTSTAQVTNSKSVGIQITFSGTAARLAPPLGACRNGLLTKSCDRQVLIRVPAMTVLAHIQPKRAPSVERSGARKKLKLLTAATTARGGTANVLVLDISTSGILVQSDAPLEVGEAIEVQLPGTGARQAQVVWSGGNFFGCSFDRPISSATVSAALLRSEPGAPEAPASSVDAVRSSKGFASCLASLRTERGWTIERLAELLGVSRQAVWYWETGQRLPRPGALKKVAEVFGVMERDLLAEPDMPRSGVAATVAELRKQLASRIGCEVSKIQISVEL